MKIKFENATPSQQLFCLICTSAESGIDTNQVDDVLRDIYVRTLEDIVNGKDTSDLAIADWTDVLKSLDIELPRTINLE